MIDEKTLKELEYDEEWGISEAEIEERFNEVIRLRKELAKVRKEPTSEYDEKKRKPYILYPDGHREY